MGEGKVILGDSAFAEVDASMCIPYDRPTTHERRLYNFMHSSARFRVGYAFYGLKQNFPYLRCGLAFELANAGTVMTACVVLYNLMLHHDGMCCEPAEHVRTPQPAATGRAAGLPPRGAGSARDRMGANLAENHIVRVFGEPGSTVDRRRRAEDRHQRRRATQLRRCENI